MPNCLFCKIITGEIPCHRVYEDEDVFAFLDIAPVNPGHILVVPKKHFEDMEDIGNDELAKLMVGVKKVGKMIKNGLGVAGYNVIQNNKKVAGQLIDHIHFHILPRLEGDGLRHWPGRKYEEGVAEKVLNKILEINS